MKRLLSRLSVGAIAAAAMLATAPVKAQDYPKQDIHAIVGFPAGSGADVYARYFANKLSQVAKVNVIVENKPGANSSIATEYVARSKPDGYTIFIGGSDVFGSPLYLFKKPPVDPRKDFIYVSPLVSQGFILTVPADKPYNNVAELTAAMKAKGDKASYPTTNNPALILGEAYKKSAGLNTVQVGYKTSADFLNDMMSGTLDWVWADPVFGLARIREGKFKPLAISTGKRISALPDIPTAKEAGIADIDMNLWWVTAVPAGTPQPIVDKLNAVVHRNRQDAGDEGIPRPRMAPSRGRLLSPRPTALINKEIKDWEVYTKLGKIEPQ